VPRADAHLRPDSLAGLEMVALGERGAGGRARHQRRGLRV